MKRALIAAVLVLAGCQDALESAVADRPIPATEQPVRETATGTPRPTPPAVLGSATNDGGVYTSLEGCEILMSSPEEAGYSVERCPGLGGYGVRINESDGRRNLFVVAPGGRPRSLNLPGVIGSGFSELGPRVEWRGGATPKALIVRYAVVEDPATPERPVSYLAVASVGESGCVIGKIPPGPDQNAAARRLADTGGPCLPSP